MNGGTDLRFHVASGAGHRHVDTTRSCCTCVDAIAELIDCIDLFHGEVMAETIHTTLDFERIAI
jgi:hypothetical protein